MAGDKARKKVLVIDDEPDVRTLSKRILENQGYFVSEAGSVDEGLFSFKEVVLIKEVLLRLWEVGVSELYNKRVVGNLLIVFVQYDNTPSTYHCSPRIENGK